MSENNNQPRALSDVALERVMRDVLGMWEPSTGPSVQQPDSTASTRDLPEEEPKSSGY